MATEQIDGLAVWLYSRHLMNVFCSGTRNSTVSPGTAITPLQEMRRSREAEISCRLLLSVMSLFSNQSQLLFLTREGWKF